MAVDRTITGWGGWGEYIGFNTLYYDYLRDERPQRSGLYGLPLAVTGARGTLPAMP